MKAVQRLNKHTISILERYDHDTDTAIQKMESTIQMLQNVTKNQQNPAFSHAIIAKSGEKPVQNAPINDFPERFSSVCLLPSNFDEKYWLRVQGEVSKAIEKAKSY